MWQKISLIEVLSLSECISQKITCFINMELYCSVHLFGNNAIVIFSDLLLTSHFVHCNMLCSYIFGCFSLTISANDILAVLFYFDVSKRWQMK
jgi:hypothetical protein